MKVITLRHLVISTDLKLLHHKDKNVFEVTKDNAFLFVDRKLTVASSLYDAIAKTITDRIKFERSWENEKFSP